MKTAIILNSLAYYWLGQARVWQRAWALAARYNSHPTVLNVFRAQMRDCAKYAINEVRR